MVAPARIKEVATGPQAAVGGNGVGEPALAQWTPERVIPAVVKEALATFSGSSPEKKDPTARIGVLILAIVGGAAWINHESGSGDFKDSMGALRDSTYIMIDVICEAHPEAKAKCRTAEKNLDRQ